VRLLGSERSTSCLRAWATADRPDIRPFRSLAEVDAVAEGAGDYGALIRFACATGLRPEEWAALTWADVDFAARTATVNKVWVKRRASDN